MNFRSLSTFTCLQALLWGLLACLFFRVGGLYTDPLGMSFTVSFMVGHIGVFALICALLCAPFYFIGPRTLRGVCIGINSIASVFLLIDYIVYSQYRFHIGIAMLEMFFGPAGREIFVFSASTWVMTILGILGIILLEWQLTVLAQKINLSLKLLLVIFLVWLVGFGSYNALYAWGKFNRISTIVSQRTVLPFAYPMSANRRLEKWGFVQPDNPYTVQAGGPLNYPRQPLVCNISNPPKNILIILIDSLRADMLSNEVMPHTTAWSTQKGFNIFTNHLSGSNATTGGVFSLFYGITHSYWDDFTAAQYSPLLITKALEQGYAPAIFASSKLTSPTFHRNVFAAIKDLRIGSEGNNSWQRDEDAVNDFLEFLNTRNNNQPFFGFIFLDAPHAYDFPPEHKIFTPSKPINYLTLNNHTDPTPYLNQYKNAVHFTDAQIERILQDLKKRNLLQNTLIFITGDHGQELNDSHKNYWGHNGNFTDFQTKVPLIVYDSSRPHQIFNYRTTHYDVAPTLLQEVFGCQNPPADYSIGQNVFDATPRPYSIFSDATAKAIRIGDQILVIHNFEHVEQYDPFLNPLPAAPNPALVKEALKTFTNFYK